MSPELRVLPALQALLVRTALGILAQPDPLDPPDPLATLLPENPVPQAAPANPVPTAPPEPRVRPVTLVLRDPEACLALQEAPDLLVCPPLANQALLVCPEPWDKEESPVLRDTQVPQVLQELREIGGLVFLAHRVPLVQWVPWVLPALLVNQV